MSNSIYKCIHNKKCNWKGKLLNEIKGTFLQSLEHEEVCEYFKVECEECEKLFERRLFSQHECILSNEMILKKENEKLKDLIELLQNRINEKDEQIKILTEIISKNDLKKN
jgi:hypothetical protein